MLIIKTATQFVAMLLFCNTAWAGNSEAVVLQYSDGSGNTYILKKDDACTLEYKPVKPAFSSSGIYDGGKAFKNTISFGQFSRMQKLLKRITGKNKDIALARQKGTGLVFLHKGLKRTRFILKRNSRSMKIIEKALKKLALKTKKN